MGTNRNITTDNWFTSLLELAEQLLATKLTLVGTLRKNKGEVPPHMLVKNLPPTTTRFLHAPKKTLFFLKNQK